MSRLEVRDPAWQAILTDERLRRARSLLSLHELRLIVNHARAAVNEQLHEAGLIRTIRGIGCAACDNGMVPDDMNWRAQDYKLCPQCTNSAPGGEA